MHTEEQFVTIGIDVGGTKIAAGTVLFPQGKVLEKHVLATNREEQGAVALEDLCFLAERLHASALPTAYRPRAIGIGVCELVDNTGKIVSNNCLRWSTEELHSRLSHLAPAIIEADVRAAALAESRFGAGRGVRVFLYISVGTGISCSLVHEGIPFRGGRGASGTMASGPLPCSGPGSLEDFASGPALVKRFNGLGGNAAGAQDVVAACEAGSPSAIEVVQGAAKLLGATIGWLINVLDPECVILGGSLGLREGLFREVLVSSAREHIWWEGHRNLQILSAALGNDAALIGAAYVAAEGIGC